MFVRRLIINDFRSYDHFECDFDESRILISGENGIGKTNILEAIHYMTIGRSLRKAETEQLIHFGRDQASIYLVYHSESDDKDHTLSCLLTQNGKSFAVDDEKVSTTSKILRKLIAICYEPSLVFFFRDDPESRRKFLDESLSQISQKYLFAIARYKKILKQRNSALQQDYDSDVIDVLRNELINLSYRIVKDRKDFIKKMDESSNIYYRRLFQGGCKELHLQYRTNCPTNDDQETYMKNCLELFEKNKSVETMRKVTVIGPHRDDLNCLLDRKDIATTGSQGENRLASLSLKLALADELEKVLGNRPILLLDDITSDLDSTRCESLLKLIDEKKQQVFVTGTENKKGFEEYTIYETDGKSLKRR